MHCPARSRCRWRLLAAQLLRDQGINHGSGRRPAERTSKRVNEQHLPLRPIATVLGPVRGSETDATSTARCAHRHPHGAGESAEVTERAPIAGMRGRWGSAQMRWQRRWRRSGRRPVRLLPGSAAPSSSRYWTSPLRMACDAALLPSAGLRWTCSARAPLWKSLRQTHAGGVTKQDCRQHRR